MAFPSVSDITQTSNSTAQASHSVDLPATVDANDLLILIVAGYQRSITTPAGWTSKSSSGYQGIFVKKAAGTEDGGTVTVEFDGDVPLAAQVYRIAASSWSQDVSNVQVGTEATGATKTPDPPSVTASWGSDDNLFIESAGSYNDDQEMSAASTNYTNLTNTISGGGDNAGCGVATARRELASDSDDPGIMDKYPLNQFWGAQTIVIKPVSAGGGLSMAVAMYHYRRLRN